MYWLASSMVGCCVIVLAAFLGSRSMTNNEPLSILVTLKPCHWCRELLEYRFPLCALWMIVKNVVHCVLLRFDCHRTSSSSWKNEDFFIFVLRQWLIVTSFFLLLLLFNSYCWMVWWLRSIGNAPVHRFMIDRSSSSCFFVFSRSQKDHVEVKTTKVGRPM